jgi:ribosomal protein L7/L12
VRGIKYVRTLYNLGLKEAKDLCDDIGELTGSREDPFSNLK